MAKHPNLENFLYGNELPQLMSGSEALVRWVEKSSIVNSLDDSDWQYLSESVQTIFSQRRSKVFGGPITAGDAMVIAVFMRSMSPNFMIEIGVASGISSLTILTLAERLRLLESGKTFLTSVDVSDRSDIGINVFNRPELLPYWRLLTGRTSDDLEVAPDQAKALAFVDGGHKHPWPLIDIIALRRVLAEGSWVLLQDVNLSDRWLADALQHDVKIPSIVRGVSLIFSLWPGNKFHGQGINYNTSAIQLSIDDDDFKKFVDEAMKYPFEDGAVLPDEVYRRIEF